MTKKLLPKIKAPSPEVAEVLETDARNISVGWNIEFSINDQFIRLYSQDQVYKSYFDVLVRIRKILVDLYTFLNYTLGTHYVVKNDTESNLRDLGIK